MKFEWVPLLGLQAAVYDLPKSKRFDAYLDTMMDAERSDLRYPPLGNLNPMANRNVASLIHELQELEAESIGLDVVQAASTKYTNLKSSTTMGWKVGLVLADDAGGGWTSYADVEYKHLFNNYHMLNRGWIDVILWSSNQAPTKESVRIAVETCIHRTAYQEMKGRISKDQHDLTLGDMLEQEAWVWDQVSSHSHRREQPPSLEIEGSIQILQTNAAASDYPTAVAGLFGDYAATSLGHPSLSLGDCCGLDLCRHGLWTTDST